MGLVLPPTLICVSGMSAAGKSSVSGELARRITNASYFDRDSILYGGLLYVNERASAPDLPSFREYAKRDSIFPNNFEEIDTPFGLMTLVYHDSFPKPPDYQARHGREQGYLVAGR